MSSPLVFFILILFVANLVSLYLIRETLNDILKLISPVASELSLKFFTIIDGRKEEVKNMFLPISKKLPLILSVVDLKGNPAVVDGLPVWALSDESLATLEVAADGMSAMVVPVGPLGKVIVQAKADADMGAGVKEILGQMEVEMVAGEAVTMVMSAGEPVELV